MINPSGIITTFAGNGVSAYAGDGGPAALASFSGIWGVATDPYGNVLIDDIGGYIRKVSPSGIITTIAGNGTCTWPGTGNGGQAVSATLCTPQCIATDPWGNIYFGDAGATRIRKINISTGIITTIAGTTYGYGGDGGLAINAAFEEAWGIAYCNGNIYISDFGTATVRMIDPAGYISTIAGYYAPTNNYGQTGNGGPARNAWLYGPLACTVDCAGNLYIGQSDAEVRKISTGCACAPTFTITITPTITQTRARTWTPTLTLTPTPTITWTPTLTPTLTPTPTLTATPTLTVTPTGTWFTPTATFTWQVDQPLPTLTPTPPCAIHLWPDPFNPQTALWGLLKVDCLPLGGTVSIYTVSGELVASVHEYGGLATWNGQNQYGLPASAGIYYYAIQSGTQTVQTGKFLLTR